MSDDPRTTGMRSNAYPSGTPAIPSDSIAEPQQRRWCPVMSKAAGQYPRITYNHCDERDCLFWGLYAMAIIDPDGMIRRYMAREGCTYGRQIVAGPAGAEPCR